MLTEEWILIFILWHAFKAILSGNCSAGVFWVRCELLPGDKYPGMVRGMCAEIIYQKSGMTEIIDL